MMMTRHRNHDVTQLGLLLINLRIFFCSCPDETQPGLVHLRHGKPPQTWANRLTRIFGTKDWEAQFYSTEESRLLEGYTITQRVANIEKIGEFFVSQLRSVFAAVADPLVLRNSQNSPLFLFCFAAANEKGAKTAVKIAQNIIGKKT